MRVAVITTSYPGAEADPAGHFVQAEARQLIRLGHEVVVFAPDARATGDGIDVIGGFSLGAFGWPGAAARLRARPYRIAGVARWASHTRAALVHAGPFDRIVAHWSVPSAWPIATGDASRAELEVVSHGGDVRLLVAMPAPVRAHGAAAIARRAARWRVVSESLRDALTAGLPARRRDDVEAIACVTPSHLEMPDVRARSRALRLAARRPIVCCVGRLVASKRVDRIIAHVARSHAEKQLVVIGDGPERGRIERLARRSSVDARFLGLLPRDEALAWIGASEALLFASEAEGCSTVLREAEALGIRVEVVPVLE